MNSQRGSAIIMLFITAALFGLVSYAFLQGSRSNVETVKIIRTDAEATQSSSCSTTLSMATKRLQARGCGTLVSYNSDGSAITGGPSDGSCSMYHTNGGGVKDCDGTAVQVGGGGPPPDPELCMDSLTAGQACVGAVYIGTVSSNRIFAAPADAASTNWNNGTTTWTNITGATSNTDGKANTDAIMAFGTGAPYRAAAACRGLGAKWYLPAPAELNALYTVRNTGAINGTLETASGGGSRYWSSRQMSNSTARAVRMQTNANDDRNKDDNLRIRCIRQR